MVKSCLMATAIGSVRSATLLSSLSFAVFGACLTLPGALLPLLVDAFGIRLIEAGSMLALQPAAYLVAVLTAGPLLERYSARAVLTGGLAAISAGFGGFGVASAWVSGGCMLFISGIGLGLIEVAVNVLLIRVGGERRSNLLNFTHLFFGVGSFAAPVLSTHAVALGFSWRTAFFSTAVLAAIVGFAWTAIPSVATKLPPEVGSGDRTTHTRLVALLAATLGVYVGLEMGVGAWLTKYLVSTRQLALADAGNVLSLYWLGLAGARLLLGFSAHRVREEHLVPVLSAMSVVALVLALSLPTPAAYTTAFALVGVGLSGIFPAVLALAGRYHPHGTARVTSLLVAGAGLGGIVIPWLMSLIADRVGLVSGMGFYVAIAAVLFLLALAIGRALPARA